MMDKKSRLLVMGKLYFKNKDYKLAESSLIEYLNSSPEDFQALKLLAQTYEFQRDFSKAFDAYERCYLAEPDRKGVLLDLCRLLLMNDSSLDHIDSKKWLKAAIQYFPSNPIVVNLKQSLPVSVQAPSKTSIEDKIFDKLAAIESRLEQIEAKLEAHLDAKLDTKLATEMVTRLDNKVEAKLADLSLSQSRAKSLMPAPAPAPTPASTPMSASKPAAALDFSPCLTSAFASSISSSLASASTPQAPTLASTTGPISSLTSISTPAPTPAPTRAQTPAPKADLARAKTPVSSPAQAPTPAPAPVPALGPLTNPMPSFTFGGLDSGNLFSNSLRKFNVEPAFGQQNNPKDAPVETGNLFADSLRKFNVESTFGQSTGGLGNTPSSGSLFSSSLSKFAADSNSTQQNDDEDGPVPTEELPIEDNCDMKPIEIKSGEEDEDIIFKERCKLYRFRDKEYKERGLGDLKVLKHRETGKIRLIMRRELVNLVCLNCWSCSNVERVRDNQLRFGGMDVSDGEASMTVFLAKFKTSDMADRFESHLKELVDN